MNDACGDSLSKHTTKPTLFNIYKRLIFVCFQAVGEPPLFLASSVFYAIKDAVMAAR